MGLLIRTVLGIACHFVPLEHSIRHLFLPALHGRLPSGDDERLFLSLPPSLGGLGIVNPMDCADR